MTKRNDKNLTKLTHRLRCTDDELQEIDFAVDDLHEDALDLSSKFQVARALINEIADDLEALITTPTVAAAEWRNTGAVPASHRGGVFFRSEQTK